MRYGELRQQGYAVASAAVESAQHGVVHAGSNAPGSAGPSRGQQILAVAACGESPLLTTVATGRHLIGPPYRRRAAA
jgi:hypothetical protein